MNRSLMEPASRLKGQGDYMGEYIIKLGNRRTMSVMMRGAPNILTHFIVLAIRASKQFKQNEPLTRFSPKPALTNSHLEGCA